jgi:hypothetical protein
MGSPLIKKTFCRSLNAPYKHAGWRVQAAFVNSRTQKMHVNPLTRLSNRSVMPAVLLSPHVEGPAANFDPLAVRKLVMPVGMGRAFVDGGGRQVGLSPRAR